MTVLLFIPDVIQTRCALICQIGIKKPVNHIILRKKFALLANEFVEIF